MNRNRVFVPAEQKETSRDLLVLQTCLTTSVECEISLSLKSIFSFVHFSLGSNSSCTNTMDPSPHHSTLTAILEHWVIPAETPPQGRVYHDRVADIFHVLMEDCTKT